MFIEPWMIFMIVAAFGACAYYSHKSGHRDGILVGIEGTFKYLENGKVIKFHENGTIEGLKNKIVLNITDMV